MKLSPPKTPILEELRYLLRNARAPRIRTMAEFVQDELIIPDGPYQGERFRFERQPYSRLWFDAVDSGIWNRFVATGPSQSGKTLSCFVAPILYHLFEWRDAVVCGVPDINMASDKWYADILPAIEATRYRVYLPKRGGGSRGGRVAAIRFTNGATLRFMSGGGGDKSVAGFTARVLVVTETDGMDEAGETSRESDRITQLETRTKSYGSKKRVYMECTVSVEEGRTWQEYTKGTHSRIVVPCPHCEAWVTPGREHLLGWSNADNELQASADAAFHCPECARPFTHEERAAAVHASRLVHGDQEIDPDGEISGELPETRTLGFRWSAFNNLFLTSGDVGADEWRASRSDDEENAEKEMCQFIWALPYKPPKVDDTPLKPGEIVKRTRKLVRGVVPADVEYLTCGLDLGRYMAHYVLTAWWPDFTGHVVDYGILGIPTDDLGVEAAILATLREFREMVESGWAWREVNRVADRVWIDAGYQGDIVKAFCREAGNRYMPAYGRSVAHPTIQAYSHPAKRQKKGNIRHVGERYYIARSDGMYCVFVDADHWKSFVHARLATPPATPGSLTLHASSDREKLHLEFAKQITAEKRVQEFVAGKGMLVRWERLRKKNHYFDALYNSAAAAHLCGARLVHEEKPREKPRQRIEQMDMGLADPDGRPFFTYERNL